MQRPIKIGFLTPYSSVYPYYHHHITTAWMIGMGVTAPQNSPLQFIYEYAGNGSMRMTQQAIKKLQFIDQVDVFSGLISYKALPEIFSFIDKQHRPSFFFDMGEYIPSAKHLNPNTFLASHQLWQSQFALGHWAQKQFGDAGHIVLPLYESGYHLNSAFTNGAQAAGGTAVHLTVLHDYPGHQPGTAINYEPFFESLVKTQPPYVHAIFSGNQGTDFLKLWISKGFHKKIPLVVIETMAYDDVLADIAHIDMQFYSSMMWNRDDETPLNQSFVKPFEQLTGQKANIYALLGYEAGLAWKEVLPYALKQDWSTVTSLLHREVIQSPRGTRSFSLESGNGLPSTQIIKVNVEFNKTQRIIVEQGKGKIFADKDFESIHEYSVSGWQNPFLCI
ncbi:hypothetical protein COR50_15000 [Chitinophaga caeni]|uniref:Leucine-binding protein domain-containing protein n=1 Tax=Chitinophaga caeni TaxID=2029983 RepID=A0A291QWX4_9BACT|nr:ABC transporter substrate-binding protein [Chitinophaga caeni]ATL48363.1 hypothetical protein COR50_15000 [Chitinophaga caeni]